MSGYAPPPFTEPPRLRSPTSRGGLLTHWLRGRRANRPATRGRAGSSGGSGPTFFVLASRAVFDTWLAVATLAHEMTLADALADIQAGRERDQWPATALIAGGTVRLTRCVAVGLQVDLSWCLAWKEQPTPPEPAD